MGNQPRCLSPSFGRGLPRCHYGLLLSSQAKDRLFRPFISTMGVYRQSTNHLDAVIPQYHSQHLSQHEQRGKQSPQRPSLHRRLHVQDTSARDWSLLPDMALSTRREILLVAVHPSITPAGGGGGVAAGAVLAGGRC